jgi:hypothetical protein
VGASFSPLWKKHGHWGRDFFSPSPRSNLAFGPISTRKLITSST